MFNKIKTSIKALDKNIMFGAFVVVALIVIIGVVSAAYSKVNKGAVPPPLPAPPGTPAAAPALPGTPSAPVTSPEPPVPKKNETLEKIKAFFEKLFAKPEDKEQIIYLRPNVKLACNVV